MDDRPLSIAFVVDRFGARYGGAEAYGVALMQELSSAGHLVTVFARAYDPDCSVRLPFRRLAVGARWPGWIRVWLFARRAARATGSGFDIVHSHMNGWCGDVEVMHVTPVRYRWGVQPRSWLRRALATVSPRVRIYLWLEARRMAPRAAHRVVAVSALIAHQLREAYGDALADVPVVPPGVAAAPAPGDAVRREQRQAVGVPPEATLCLMVARNPLRKGLPTVLRALGRLPAAFHLVVVGANAAARACVAGAPDEVAARVHLVAETSRVEPYYQAADVFVHPTLNDSFGMAPLEAMAHGLPVILSPAPWCGFAQYVQAEESALVLSHPERDDELARALTRLRNDAALRARLLAGARVIVARHGWPEVARCYLALYRQILDERGPAAGLPVREGAGAQAVAAPCPAGDQIQPRAQ